MSSPILTCLCGDVTTPCVPIDGLKFPIYRPVCHCDSCRHSSGALFGAFPRLEGPLPDAVLAACTRYLTAGETGIRRYFCPRCGTHVCFFGQDDNSWHGCVGAIETSGHDSTVDRIRVRDNFFVSDTIDGGILGASPSLVKMRYRPEDTADIPCYKEWPSGEHLSLSSILEMAAKSKTAAVPEVNELLTARCHCGGTDLRLRRANYAEQTQGVESRHIPDDKTKYRAYLCACRSCRIANGVTTLAPWATVPPSNLSVASTGKAVVFGPAAMQDGANSATTLRHYWSSKNVCWSFCGTCGATIVYWNADRPDVVDVAVGILRAPEGAMARGWLDWKLSEIAFAEEAVDRDLCKAIVAKE